jgi:branched-subunit amino acid aminotransferase/4-amino-4-deoxychorismate lyase
VSEPLVFLNGDLLPASRAHLAIYDAGLVFGATVTEMTRTFSHQPFRLQDHLDRLFRSLSSVGFDIGMSRDELSEVSQKLLAHNAAQIETDDELGLIHFVTAGEYSRYASSPNQAVRTTPTICVHTFPLALHMWAAKIEHGAHLITPQIRHVPPECYDPQIKNRSRLHYYLAEQEARSVDPDASALLLDLDGNVTETSAANFLMVEQGTIVSPPLARTLPGISRQTVSELAGKLGIPFVERDIALSEALRSDEALLSSTSYCLLPVTRINGTAIGSGQPGPLFARLIDGWSGLVGLDIRRQILCSSGGNSRRGI